MDKIVINDLLIRCIIGIYPHEREHPQDVLINLTLFCDLQKAADSDRVEDSVDYKKLKFNLVELIEGTSFKLIEALAGQIAGVVLENPRVAKVRVRVDKPGALSYARSVGVEIERENKKSG